jgi:putative ABC transport system permease protein
MSRTLVSYYALEPGFDVDKLVTARLDLPYHRYPNEQARRAFFSQLDARLRAHQGIHASAYGWGIPPEVGYSYGAPEAEGDDPHPEMEYPANVVSPGYFAATGTPIVAGRAFTATDHEDVRVISESLAQLLWPNHSPIGRRMRSSEDGPWVTVVGVAGDVEGRTDEGRNALHLYEPIIEPPQGFTSNVMRPRAYIHQVLIVRADNPASAAGVIREEVRALDRDLPLGQFKLGTELYGAPFSRQQFLLRVMAAFAAMALLLAAMGIFGVLSQAVTRRRREIGIRVALGAGHARLIRMIVGRGLALAAVGAIVGTAASLLGVRTLESLLFGVSPFDPASFAGVIAILLAVALIACWWPARRALAVEPAEVLRSE